MSWYRHGDTTARDLLIRANLHHVVAIARRHGRNHSATFEELVAEGNFGLIRALVKFDPERGTRFVTYAAFWIRAYMFQYSDAEGTERDRPHSVTTDPPPSELQTFS